MVTRGKAIEVLAYTAGIIDGEGHIGIDKTGHPVQRRRSVRYQPTVAVVNTNKPLIDWLQAEYGGSVNQRRQEKPHHRPTYRWKISNRAAAEFCEVIGPYLKVKHLQAALIVEFMRTCEFKRVGHVMVPEELILRRGNFHLQMLKLNDDRRPQRLSETASEVDEAIV